MADLYGYLTNELPQYDDILYKMTKRKGTNITPYSKNTELIPYEGQLTPPQQSTLYDYIINDNQ